MIDFYSLSPTQQDYAMAHGYVGLFAQRETLNEALEYAYKLAEATENSMAVLTAVHVVLNTVALLDASAQPAEPATEDALS